MKNFFKKIPLSLKIFSATIIFVVFSIFLLLVFPTDYSGKICGAVNLAYLSFFVLFLGSFLTFLVALREFIVCRKKRYLLILIISLFLSLVIFLMFISINSGERAKSKLAATKASIESFRVIQELFYDEHGRYAQTQQELIDAGSIKQPILNLLTEKELTDKDGDGIEGGDNDPNTWSVSVYFPRVKIGSFCKVISEGYWFTCDQTGECYEEEVPVK